MDHVEGEAMEVILQSVLVILIVIAMVSYYFILPKKDPINISEIPEPYVIQTSNKIELQKHYECAAFTSAYVLRHFGIEADGDQLYKKFPGKLLDGAVSLKGIILLFRKLDYKVSYYYGNVDTLKQQLS